MEVVIDGSSLKPVETQPPLGKYIKSLYDRRYFIIAEARGKAFRISRDTILGKLWLIIQPIMQACMYGAVFGLLLRTSKGLDNFIGFLLIGITFFGLMNKQFTAGGGVLPAGKGLITSFKFPTVAVPVASSVQIALDTLPAAIMSLIIAQVLQPEKPLTWSALCVVPLFLLMQLFGCGLMLIVARVAVFVPDLKIVVGFIASAWFFSSGVFYSLERYADDPKLYSILSKNPGYFYVQAVRDAVLGGIPPTGEQWLLYVSTALISVSVGFLFFWTGESRYRSAL